VADALSVGGAPGVAGRKGTLPSARRTDPLASERVESAQDRTRAAGVGRAAAREPTQRIARRLKLGNLAVERTDARTGHLSRQDMIARHVELEEPADLVQREAGDLGCLDEAQAADVILAVPANPQASPRAGAAARLRQKLPSLIKPDRFDTDATRTRQPSNRHLGHA
jgi:hypothetical protein